MFTKNYEAKSAGDYVAKCGIKTDPKSKNAEILHVIHASSLHGIKADNLDNLRAGGHGSNTFDLIEENIVKNYHNISVKGTLTVLKQNPGILVSRKREYYDNSGPVLRLIY